MKRRGIDVNIDEIVLPKHLSSRKNLRERLIAELERTLAVSHSGIPNEHASLDLPHLRTGRATADARVCERAARSIAARVQGNERS